MQILRLHVKQQHPWSKGVCVMDSLRVIQQTCTLSMNPVLGPAWEGSRPPPGVCPDFLPLGPGSPTIFPAPLSLLHRMPGQIL